MEDDPNDPIWGPRPWPDKFQGFRPGQLDAINQTLDILRTKPAVMLNAPTGVGKTVIAEGVRRRLGILPVRGVYVCTTKALQDQFEESFPYAHVIKGRRNYLTESGMLDEFGNRKNYGYSAITCADCTYNSETEDCRWCTSHAFCPYRVAKGKALNGDLAVVNSSYFLTDSNIGSAAFTDRELAIMDEADLIESNLLNHVEVVIREKEMEKMWMLPPDKKTVESSWIAWVDGEALPKARRHQSRIVPIWDEAATRDDIREWKRTQDLIDRLLLLQSELPSGGWIYDGYKSNDVIFRPIRVSSFGEELLWNHANKFLMMSSTILSADLRASDWGLNLPYSMVDIPSPFPLKNRPVHFIPMADMGFSYNFKETDKAGWAQMARSLEGVFRAHPDERILVHTVSYDLSRYLVDRLTHTGREIYTYSDSEGKSRSLEDYRRTSAAVMVAASMDRGIDFPDDDCRVGVVAKLPNPNLGDKRTYARLKSQGGRVWYRMQAAADVIQMAGRHVRSPTDYGVTYILDSQFKELWKEQYLFPEWFRKSVNFRTEALRRRFSGNDGR